MLVVFAFLVALASMGFTLMVFLRLRSVEERHRALESRPTSPQGLSAPVSKPLEGLRIGIDIRQDYPHPLFTGLLIMVLTKEDVSDAGPSISEPDIVIEGELTCNGYSDVYYRAEFTCSLGGEPLCTLIERPPHGDRPVNLVIELVERLKLELERAVERRDRQKAIRELRGP